MSNFVRCGKQTLHFNTLSATMHIYCGSIMLWDARYCKDKNRKRLGLGWSFFSTVHWVSDREHTTRATVELDKISCLD